MPLHLIRLLRGALPSALLLAGACADATGPDHPSLAQTYSDLSAALGVASPGVETVEGLPETGFADPSSCTHQPEGHFQCPVVVTGGITIDRRLYFLDADGEPLAEWSPAVRALRQTVSMGGTYSLDFGEPGVVYTVELDDEATLGGIGTGTLTLDGLATWMITKTGVTEVTTALGSRATDLVLGPSGGYPTGTVESESGLASSSIMRTSRLIFDGTATVVWERDDPLGGPPLRCTFVIGEAGLLDCESPDP